MNKKNNHNNIKKKRYKYNAYTIIFHFFILMLFFSYGAFKITSDNENKSKVIEVEIFQEENNSISATTISSHEEIEKILSLEDIKRTFTLEERLDYEIKKEKERANKAKIEQQKLKEIREKRLEEIRRKREIDTKNKLKEKELNKKKQLEEDNRIKEQKRLKEDRIKKEALEKLQKEKLNNIFKPKIKKTLSKEQYLKTSNGRNDFNNYSSALYSKVYSKWVKPFNAKTGWNCSLEIKQDIQGRVVDIKYIKCNPNNKDLVDSVKRAIVSSSPLPLPNDRRLFDNSVRFTFSVE